MANYIITTEKAFDGKTIHVATCRFSGNVAAVARRRPFESTADLEARLIASAADADLIAIRDSLDRAAG